MPPAGLPLDEPARLRSVARLGSFETLRDHDLDRLVCKAAHAMGVPTAMLSLLSERRQFFVSRFGQPFSETSREQAFCAHAILSAEPLICRDARLDARFLDNPLVTAPPGIRFYAGVPVFGVGGHALGTLCTIDYTPREPTARSVRALRSLAGAVTARLNVLQTVNDAGSAMTERLAYPMRPAPDHASAGQAASRPSSTA